MFLAQNYAENDVLISILAGKRPLEALPILDAINELDFSKKLEILSQESKLGKNSLVFAAERSPKVFNRIMNLISNMDENLKSQLLLRTTKNGLSPLSMACVRNPPIAVCILNMFEEFHKPELMYQLLSAHTQCKGDNALMFSLIYKQPTELVNLVLEKIQNLEMTQRQAILTQTNTDGSTALMLAAQFNPHALASLITALNSSKLNQTFAQTNAKGLNFLMLAMIYNPAAVDISLEALNVLPTKVKAALLTQVSYTGHNLLTLAVMYNPSLVETILGALKQLTNKVRSTMFKQVSTNKENILTLAIQQHPSSISLFRQIINAIPQSERFAMLTGVLKHYPNNKFIIEELRHLG